MNKITKLFLILFFLSVTSNAQFTTGNVSLNYGMEVTIETQPTEVTLTLKGPDNKWFAIGFGGQSMGTVTDVFAYDGTGIFDKIGQNYAAPQNDINQDWSIVSNTATGTSRTIVATRALSGSDATDYTFTNTNTNIPIIYAHGTGMTLEYHENRDLTSLSRSEIAGINDINQFQFTMYPNPVQNKLTVVLESNLTDVSYEIYSVIGKKIASGKLNNIFNEVNISNYTSGIYLLKIHTKNKGMNIRKFVKK